MSEYGFQYYGLSVRSTVQLFKKKKEIIKKKRNIKQTGIFHIAMYLQFVKQDINHSKSKLCEYQLHNIFPYQ